MNAKITLQNGDVTYVNDLDKILRVKYDSSTQEEPFPEFIFYPRDFYKFIGQSHSLCVWGKDIHHIEFSNSKY